jgi:ferrous iron transport protein B
MHRRAAAPSSAPADTRSVRVAICGNPNCGKTTIFNAITGLRQKVGNYPGVTVDRVSGEFKIPSVPDTRFDIVDIPGTYSLAAFSPDEYIAARALFGAFDERRPPDIIVCVIDATNLERGLYLLFQVMQIGQPVVVALNMVDLAGRKGVFIDARQLSEDLGDVPVVEVIGSRRVGIDQLKTEVGRLARQPVIPKVSAYPPSVAGAAEELARDHAVDQFHIAEYMRVLLDADGPAEKEFISQAGKSGAEALAKMRRGIKKQFGGLSSAETTPLTKRAAELVEQAVQETAPPRPGLSDRIDRWVLHPVAGPIILLTVMTLIFQSIFSWAEPVMNLVDTLFGFLAASVEGALQEGPLRSLLTDGIIGGIGSVIVFLPQIMILFFFIALLEDSGYMPRAAFLVDRAFRWCGLSGKSFIPMLSSFACAVPGIMATRTIEDRKLRIITIMVSPLMTCSARLPVYAILIAAFIPHRTYVGIFNSQGLVLTALYLLGIVVAVVVSFILKRLIFKAESGTFLMELPSYKWPTLSSVAIRVLNRAKSFLVRAGTVIAAITVVVWALSYYPRSVELNTEFELSRAATEQTYAAETAAINQRIDALITSEQSVSAATADSLISLAARAESDNDLNALLPATGGVEPVDRIVQLVGSLRRLELSHGAALTALARDRSGAMLRQSYFARMGKLVEPVFAPMGWDWRITMATLSSFPAREVIIATLGTIFNLGSEVDGGSESLVDKLRRATRDSGPLRGQRLFTPAVALSVMVFFALCCQCGATVVTIRQEAGHWGYAVGTFLYMTGIAYVSGIITYRAFLWLGF